MKPIYGLPPIDLGHVHVDLPEVMYYLYLPVSLAGRWELVLPRRLRPIMPVLDKVRANIGEEKWKANNIYVTVKKMFVSPSVTANRPGWHADGFGTDDLNFVWYDSLPTIFNTSLFSITPNDHVKSLLEFEEQAMPEYNRTYPEGHVLKLDQQVVHSVAMAKEQMMRTFIKISVSKDKYNLKDNSINHDLDYNWKTYDRAVVRNDPNAAQKDSFNPTPADDHFA